MSLENSLARLNNMSCGSLVISEPASCSMGTTQSPTSRTAIQTMLSCSSARIRNYVKTDRS
eukprot:5624805-Amphidinium_carterae.1